MSRVFRISKTTGAETQKAVDPVIRDGSGRPHLFSILTFLEKRNGLFLGKASRLPLDDLKKINVQVSANLRKTILPDAVNMFYPHFQQVEGSDYMFNLECFNNKGETIQVVVSVCNLHSTKFLHESNPERISRSYTAANRYTDKKFYQASSYGSVFPGGKVQYRVCLLDDPAFVERMDSL